MKGLSGFFSVLVIGAALGAGVASLLYAQSASVEPRPPAPRVPLSDQENSTIEQFALTAPSVVSITTLSVVRDFWSMRADAVPQGSGSGFVWDARGHIVTNYHVLSQADVIRVTLYDQRTVPAKVVGVAPEHDLAVLSIEAEGHRLIPIPVGVSKDLQVGQRVMAIGNPFGLDHSLTVGVVSALDRSIESMTGRDIRGVVQTDASINPGNSGGPLLDSAGRLIGVNTAIRSPSGASAGVGFAVPVDTVNRLIPKLIRYGKVIRPRLGIRLAHRRLATRLGVEGLLVLGVESGGPAQTAGILGTRRDEAGRLLLGDVIVGADGDSLADEQDLMSQLEGRNPGDRVELTILRDERQIVVPVLLGRPGRSAR